ncbi:MAG TPA: YHS domain-containing protein, partial [Isosphaeraceae bacterium]|nr:YHS domain-containing protein [Isosphaeraceae bacterium]
METTFRAPGISCQGCANTIEKALGTIPDVSRVSVDVAKKTVTVSHGERVERETLEGALAGAGYPAAADGHAHHHHPSRGGATATVKDPVCGMDVDPENAAGRSEHAGRTYFFCSASCKRKFDDDPPRYLSGAGGQHAPATKPPEGVLYTCPMHPEIVRDKPGSCPICGMALEPMTGTGDDTNPELKDMTRRFWVCLILTAPLLLVMLAEMLIGQQPIMRLFPGRSLAWIQLV